MRRLAAYWDQRQDDAGQLTLLIIGLAAILVLLVTVVVNASKAFLVQRALSGAADGAAVAAANAVDESVIYRQELGNTLPLHAAGATAAVFDYVSDARLDRRLVGLRVVDVTTDGATATVTLGAVVDMPFVNHLSDRYAEGYPVQVTASARSPLLEP